MYSSPGFLTALILIIAFTGVASQKCPGSGMLDTTNGLYCTDSIEDSEVTEEVACLKATKEDASETCKDNNCVEMNVRIEAENSDDASTSKLYAFSTCYVAKDVVDIKLCPEGYNDDNDDNGDGTTEATDDATTEDMDATTDSSTDDGMSTFTGCRIGKYTFPKTCKVGEEIVTLTRDDGSGDTEDYILYTRTCCDTEGVCKPADDTDNTYTCLQGDDKEKECPSKAQGCWSRIAIEDGIETSTQGCLGDVSPLNTDGVEICGEDYEAHDCTDKTADGDQTCWRCCNNKEKCNTWDSLKEIKTVTEPESTTAGSVTTSSSLALLCICIISALFQFLLT